MEKPVQTEDRKPTVNETLSESQTFLDRLRLTLFASKQYIEECRRFLAKARGSNPDAAGQHAEDAENERVAG